MAPQSRRDCRALLHPTEPLFAPHGRTSATKAAYKFAAACQVPSVTAVATAAGRPPISASCPASDIIARPPTAATPPAAHPASIPRAPRFLPLPGWEDPLDAPGRACLYIEYESDLEAATVAAMLESGMLCTCYLLGRAVALYCIVLALQFVSKAYIFLFEGRCFVHSTKVFCILPMHWRARWRENGMLCT